MICMSRRSARSDRLSRVVTFLPWNQTSPEVGSMSRRMQRPVVDFPQPDSPTRPRVSPAWMSKLTPSTAWTRATSREKSPPLMGKCLTSLLTRRSASAMAVSLCVWLVEPAGDLVPRLHFLEGGLLLGVHRLHELAAGGEAAAGRHVQQARHHPRDRLQALLLGRRQVDARDRTEQALGVGVERLLEQLLD